MNKNTMMLLALTFLCLSVSADTVIKTEDLGQLALEYAEISTVSSLNLPLVKAKISHKSGEAFQLIAPFKPQSHEVLVNNGEFVDAGTAILKLSGSEVHHFLEKYDSAKSLFSLAKKRYDSNLKLFNEKSISNDKWAVISENYFRSRDEFGHYQHFSELIHSSPDVDVILIKAPIDGYYLNSEPVNKLADESDLGQILPKASVRLRAYIGSAEAEQLIYFEAGGCHIEIDVVSQTSMGYFQEVWSKPLADDCELKYGQILRVTPYQTVAAYQVPKSSVLSIKRATYILVKKAEELIVTPITIKGAEANYYIVTSTSTLDNSRVLFTSVAAVQGVLMGLGGE
ncbi:hypothetical protein OS175_09915 [Marinicella sp. S1101]|uniref:hypothetical protein n=1 Tax=Marinicella marina TaxID=2996016 RepID=UPI002260AFDC|nr:hypothetical protein [Marinicella marina]MCX7554194.1 hypothetical protein [Marinicella marina]MDJ1141113.1 hypothetical protein [Marinicella marina]